MSTKTPKSSSVTQTLPPAGGATGRWKRLLAAWRALTRSHLVAALFVVALVAYLALVPAAVAGFVLGMTFVVALLVVGPLAVLWLAN